MSNNLSFERKGQNSRTEFIIALVTYSISDDNIFAFANKWLFSETLATALYSVYSLEGPTSFSQDELVFALSEKNRRLHLDYGISGINERSFALNSSNILKYDYQVYGRTQWFYYILAEKGKPTTHSIPTVTSIQSPPSLRRITRCTALNLGPVPKFILLAPAGRDEASSR